MVNRMFTPMSLSHSFLSLESLLLYFPHYRRESRIAILRALARLPKLQVLQIVYDGEKGSPTTRFDPSSPICLSSLRELTIEWCGAPVIDEWLAIFQAPSLTTIAISPVHQTEARGFDTFNERFPSLHRMHFEINYNISLFGYAELSRYVPVIELISSVGGNWTFQQLMQALKQKRHGTYFYPSLRRLEIHSPCHLEGNSIDKYSLEALHNLVKTLSWKRASRRDNYLDTTGATLREVHIWSSEDMKPSLRKWFEKYLVCFTCSSTVLQDLEMASVRLVNGEEE